MGLANRIVLLWLASSSVALAAPMVPHEHVVQSGQTLAKIAKRYHLDLDSLCAANDLKKSAKLQPGLRLTIPSDDERNEAAPQKASVTPSHDVRSDPARKPELTRRAGVPMTSYAQYLARPTKRGWVHVMGHHGDWQGQLVGKNGKLLPKAVTALSRLLAWPRTDFSMDRRLLTLLTQVSDAFGGRTLRVVSGYRTTSYASESKHPLGRACDFHVLGVPNSALRDFIRTFDNVGVGYYPNSTFVHLDSRDHDAFWIDYAGPGEPPRTTRNRVARTSDESPLIATRAATTMKGPDTANADPEAEQDAQSRQEELLESRSEASAATTATPSKRLVEPAPQRSVPSPSVAAEPESSSAVQSDVAPLRVDL